MSRDAPWLLDEDEAVTAYESTDGFTLDAINEFATWAPEALPPTLVEQVCAWYRETNCYQMVIDDLRTGDREL